MSDLNKIYLFRMTHVGNLPHILKYGITHFSSVDSKKDYIPIGDNTLISSRNEFIMPNGKRLGDYIPFYFGSRMPMLYVIQKGFNNVISIKPEDIVYCILTVAQVVDHNLEFVFTNGHAIDHFSDFFGLNDIPRIETILDFTAIKAQYWKNENDLDLKRRKEAEFLIASDIPISALVGFVVYNEITSNKLLEMGVPEKGISVKNNFYF